MKRFLLALIAMVGTLCASAQDIIVKNDGSTVLCRIVEVNGTDVVYLKWSDLNGPRYIMDRSVVSNINYQDGRQDKINAQASNAYAPGNQQTGSSNYNDNALLALDRSRSGILVQKKIKKLKTIGWTVGPILLAGGAVCIAIAYQWGLDSESMGILVPGVILCAGGIATTTACLIRANQLKNRLHDISCAPIFEHEFGFSNGSRLTAGIDMLRDHNFKQSAFGLGFKYSF